MDNPINRKYEMKATVLIRKSQIVFANREIFPERLWPLVHITYGKIDRTQVVANYVARAGKLTAASCCGQVWK